MARTYRHNPGELNLRDARRSGSRRSARIREITHDLAEGDLSFADHWTKIADDLAEEEYFQLGEDAT